MESDRHLRHPNTLFNIDPSKCPILASFYKCMIGSVWDTPVKDDKFFEIKSSAAERVFDVTLEIIEREATSPKRAENREHDYSGIEVELDAREGKGELILNSYAAQGLSEIEFILKRICSNEVVAMFAGRPDVGRARRVKMLCSAGPLKSLRRTKNEKSIRRTRQTNDQYVLI